MYSPHKARDCINDWANSPDAGDLKSHATNFDVTVMEFEKLFCWFDRSIIITVGQWKKVSAVTFFPARPRADQRGTNTGQIRKIALYEIAWFFVYRMSSGDMAVYSFRGEGGNCGFREPRGRRLLKARKKVTVLVVKLNSFVFLKTLGIKWLRTYHRLVIRTRKHNPVRCKVAPLNILFEA